MVAVHDSKESWERLRGETLGPGLQETEDSSEGPPEETTIEVDVFGHA